MHKISVVMPYWKRPDALKRNIARYRELYPEPLEIIVVNDGSDDLPDVAATIVSLPQKDHALNPCVAFNRGVAAATGDLIVLTNPEVIHRVPILSHMAARAAVLFPRSYVAAACWSEYFGWWFCHSTGMPDDQKIGRAPSPPGAGLHFCSMLWRGLYESIGGFSEEYRDGQAYEDNDFLWKLAAAHANFVIADDCVTDHIVCPPTVWPAGGIARNRRIFEDKWRSRI